MLGVNLKNEAVKEAFLKLVHRPRLHSYIITNHSNVKYVNSYFWLIIKQHLFIKKRKKNYKGYVTHFQVNEGGGGGKERGNSITE